MMLMIDIDEKVDEVETLAKYHTSTCNSEFDHREFCSYGMDIKVFAGIKIELYKYKYLYRYKYEKLHSSLWPPGKLPSSITKSADSETKTEKKVSEVSSFYMS